MNTLSTKEMSERYMEILQPFEMFIANIYRDNSHLNDYDILQIYESLAKHIKARLTDFPLPQHKLSFGLGKVYRLLLEFLEDQEKTYTLEEIQACVKLLIKSVKRWNERHGAQGYLTFISRFF